MNYPLISEYVEAIKSAKDNFKELTNLYPIPDGQGEPVMTSGNFAVVFMMQDIETGKFYALKCFTKEQERRTESYRLIAEELGKVKSPYIEPTEKVALFEAGLHILTSRKGLDIKKYQAKSSNV